MRIPVASGAAALAIVLALSGCSGSGAPAANIITASWSEPTSPLIPAETVDFGGARVIDNIFAGLVAYTADGTVVNDVADSIEIAAKPAKPAKSHKADKGQVYTVTLRDGLTFTDGEKVDAESFVSAWDWAADSANKTPYQSSFAGIVGYVADDPTTPDIERGSLVESGGLVVLDSRTFAVHLTSPLSDFSQRLGQRAYFPLPASFFDDPASFAEKPIGNGPYMIDESGTWEHGERLDLVVNPTYTGPRLPLNDGVSLRVYKSLDTAYGDLFAGFLDLLDTLPASALPTYHDELGSGAIDQPGSTLWSITIPTQVPHFTGPEGALRRAAISMVIDRQGIADQVLGGQRTPAQDFSAPVVENYDTRLSGSEVLDFNTVAAKQKWAAAEALSTWGDSTFEIAYASDGDDGEWVAAVASSISRELGIDAVGIAYSTSTELDAAIADHSIATAFRTVQRATYPGVLSFLDGPYTSKAASNVSGYSNKDFDFRLKGALAATNVADFHRAATAAQVLLLSDLPAIPLWNSTQRAGTAEGIDGAALDWNGVPQYFQITKRR